MTRKASKRTSDENIEQNLANYLKRKSLLHQQILLQQPPPAQNRGSRIWASISNQIWSLVAKTFKKEARLNENDLFNEACAARLASQRNSYRIRSRRELDFLCKKTKFTRHEIKLLYLGWKDVCVNGYLNENTCKEIYAGFFPQASDSSLYAKHVYRALFSRNNILTNLNNNNILNSNLNDQSNEREFDLRTPSPVPGKQFKQQTKKFANQDSTTEQCRSRLRSQSTTGFKSSSSNVQSSSSTSSTTTSGAGLCNTAGLLSKRRALSLAKQTLDSSSNYPNAYLDNYLGRSSNSNLSAIQDEVYFDYPLRRSSRNASSANLSYRDTIPEKISFVEYAISLSALLKGSVEEKLAWTFQLYDTNNDGRLTVDELIEISKAVYALLGYFVAPVHDSTTYVEHGKQVFEKIDVNKTGTVSLDQFIDCCIKDETITKSLQLITANPF